MVVNFSHIEIIEQALVVDDDCCEGNNPSLAVDMCSDAIDSCIQRRCEFKQRTIFSVDFYESKRKSRWSSSDVRLLEEDRKMMNNSGGDLCEDDGTEYAAPSGFQRRQKMLRVLEEPCSEDSSDLEGSFSMPMHTVILLKTVKPLPQGTDDESIHRVNTSICSSENANSSSIRGCCLSWRKQNKETPWGKDLTHWKTKCNAKEMAPRSTVTKDTSEKSLPTPDVEEESTSSTSNRSLSDVSPNFFTVSARCA